VAEELWENEVVPYVIREGGVHKADTGKLVGKSKNPKKYLRTLNAIDHGFVPKKKKS